jgi:hypothetical protein
MSYEERAVHSIRDLVDSGQKITGHEGKSPRAFIEHVDVMNSGEQALKRLRIMKDPQPVTGRQGS